MSVLAPLGRWFPRLKIEARGRFGACFASFSSSARRLTASRWSGVLLPARGRGSGLNMSKSGWWLCASKVPLVSSRAQASVKRSHREPTVEGCKSFILHHRGETLVSDSVAQRKYIPRNKSFNHGFKVLRNGFWPSTVCIGGIVLSRLWRRVSRTLLYQFTVSHVLQNLPIRGGRYA